jgi:signal transduction histidine kinase
MNGEQEQLLQQNAELRKQLADKTSELQQKNRELEIEAALERVRAVALSMKAPADMLEVCTIIAKELNKLGVKEIRNVQTAIFYESKGTYMNYEYYARHDKTVITETSYTNHPMHHAFATQMLKGKGEFFSTHLTKAELPDWIAYQKTTNVFIDDFILTAPSLDYYWFSLGAVALGITTYSPLSEGEIGLFKRFRNVFELSYRRYLDIGKAEAQAREAEIELALERVRAKTMAMHKSDDLLDLINTLSQQFEHLGFKVDVANFNTNYREKDWDLWLWVSQTAHPERVYIPYFDHTYFNTLRESLDKGLDFNTAIFTKEEKNSFQEYLYNTVLKDVPQESKELIYGAKGFAWSVAFFNNISITIGNYDAEPYTEEQNAVLRRFGNVFEQAYTRFLDLQKAEGQAREAQIEAALERVRSRTLAMQKSDELAETAAVVFRQLIALGIAPNRLYIGIINDESGNIEFWITDEDGSKVSTMFIGNIYKNLSVLNMYNGWKAQQRSLMIHMQGKELDDYFHYLGDELHVLFKDGLLQVRRVQYISYFSRGFIGMASPDEQPVETVELLDRFAYVFNLTFTRFNDLKVAEAHALQAEQDLIEIKTARKKAEDALTELKATQKQLIQSEKMASLGELTAGIAHEIQNPLNFVNNFSEVNKEMLEELKAERLRPSAERDDDLQNDLINDVIANEEKINCHGKRADAIVKGMLQHSRTSTGQKEPTDINALCDEYLRLSYHGLRAKDKQFNADFKIDFDESLSADKAGIGKINIVPQDIGRVLLNLINNAFYTVNEKKKSYELSTMSLPTTQAGYQPLVSVQTKKLNGKVEIKVADNGNGIPESVKEKIFQPFFTTKPTGQGTGLGLSLSYDIIKAHGGEIKVNTKEGEGSTFIIQLPI